MEPVHERWQHRWVTPKAECRESEMHGLGVFAKERIPAGEVVGVLGGVVVPASEVGEYGERMGHVGIQIDDGFFMCPSDREELRRTGVFNHSCDPNIGFRDQITFVAIRDIEPEEELAFDYAFSESMLGGPRECKCGAANCRGSVSPDDWKEEDIRKRHGEYFSPYLRRRLTA